MGVLVVHELDAFSWQTAGCGPAELLERLTGLFQDMATST
jgi:hypothetical protein